MDAPFYVAGVLRHTFLRNRKITLVDRKLVSVKINNAVKP